MWGPRANMVQKVSLKEIRCAILSHTVANFTFQVIALWSQNDMLSPSFNSVRSQKNQSHFSYWGTWWQHHIQCFEFYKINTEYAILYWDVATQLPNSCWYYPETGIWKWLSLFLRHRRRLSAHHLRCGYKIAWKFACNELSTPIPFTRWTLLDI